MNKRFTRFIIVTAVMTFGLVPSQAAEWWVARDGQTPDPNAQYTNRATAAIHIQQAVDKAANGDTVWVAPGMSRKMISVCPKLRLTSTKASTSRGWWAR